MPGISGYNEKKNNITSFKRIRIRRRRHCDLNKCWTVFFIFKLDNNKNGGAKRKELL